MGGERVSAGDRLVGKWHLRIKVFTLHHVKEYSFFWSIYVY